jgi:hypothetical protein
MHKVIGPPAAIMTMAPAACAQAAHAGRDRRGAGQDVNQRRLCRYRVGRPGTRAEADCGSVPSSATSRPGASNAAHANLEGGRVEPVSTATSRVLMSSDQRPVTRVCKLTEDSRHQRAEE